MDKITLQCPKCLKGYRLTAREKDDTIRCGLCNYRGKKEEFIVNNKIK